MTPKETTEGNKLIAEFVGCHKSEDAFDLTFNIPSIDAKWYYAPQLLFDKKWDWLMLAVKKAKELGSAMWDFTQMNWALARVDIEAVFNELTDFIQWYKNKQQ